MWTCGAQDLAMDYVERLKRQATDREIYLQTTYLTEVEYLAYKKNPQNTIVKKAIYLENAQKTQIDISLKKMLDGKYHMKICSLPLAIRETQSHNEIFTTKMAKVKNSNNSKCRHGCGKTGSLINC